MIHTRVPTPPLPRAAHGRASSRRPTRACAQILLDSNATSTDDGKAAEAVIAPKEDDPIDVPELLGSGAASGADGLAALAGAFARAGLGEARATALVGEVPPSLVEEARLVAHALEACTPAEAAAVVELSLERDASDEAGDAASQPWERAGAKVRGGQWQGRVPRGPAD